MSKNCNKPPLEAVSSAVLVAKIGQHFTFARKIMNATQKTEVKSSVFISPNSFSVCLPPISSPGRIDPIRPIEQRSLIYIHSRYEWQKSDDNDGDMGRARQLQPAPP